FDVITCSLFLHHLGEDAAIELLQRMSHAAGVILVNDLRRSLPGLVAAYAGSRILTRSSVVRTDALLSVRAGYTMAEARGLATAASLKSARIMPRWPFRWLLHSEQQ